MRYAKNFMTPSSTPMHSDVDGTLQLIITGGDYLTGHDLANGKELLEREAD